MQLLRITTMKKHLLVSLTLSLAGFLLILFCLNLYQYLRVKNNVASTMLREINARGRGELQSFFNAIGEKLTIVRDWGQNGVLDSRDTISLNKKFFPLINKGRRITGVLLADTSGWEYFLMHRQDQWLTRVTLADRGKNTAVYDSWQVPEKSLGMRKKHTDYDPRKRPWFKRSADNDSILWTPLYTFLESGKKGITASVSWDKKTKDKKIKKDGFTVFGIDIALEEIQQLLQQNRDDTSGLIFLVNGAGTSILPAEQTSAGNNSIDTEKLLSVLVDKWKAENRPVLKAIRFNAGRRSWLGSLQPLVRDKTVFWIGVAVPEKKLTADLYKTLFSVDLTDFLVATGGGMLLLLLIWKNGGFHQGDRPPVDPVVRLHGLINRGEGAEVEFKSTVRTNLKTGKKGKEIEFAWLKSVVAFLNSKGGTLLIGVDDSGRIISLDADGFENRDRCLLHIKNLLNQHIGAEFSGYVHIALLTTDTGDVLVLDVERAGRPVFLRIGKNEEFYIRSGPSSVKLTPSQTVNYVMHDMSEADKF